MTFPIKPSWNPATVTLTGLALLIEWPLALPIAAYAIWGDRLTGANNPLTQAAAATRSWFAGSPMPAAAATGPAHAYHAERMADLDAQRQKLHADIEAFRAAQSERQRQEEREAFERFLNERSSTSGA